MNSKNRKEMNIRKILKFGKKKTDSKKHIRDSNIYIDLYIIFALYNYYIY